MHHNFYVTTGAGRSPPPFRATNRDGDFRPTPSGRSDDGPAEMKVGSPRVLPRLVPRLGGRRPIRRQAEAQAEADTEAQAELQMEAQMEEET